MLIDFREREQEGEREGRKEGESVRGKHGSVASHACPDRNQACNLFSVWNSTPTN